MPFSQLSSVMLELCPHLFWKPELYLPSLTKSRKSLPDTAISLFSSKSFLKNKVYNTNNLLEYKELLLYIIYNSNVLGWPTHPGMPGTSWGFLVFALKVLYPGKPPVSGKSEQVVQIPICSWQNVISKIVYPLKMSKLKENRFNKLTSFFKNVEQYLQFSFKFVKWNLDK